MTILRRRKHRSRRPQNLRRADIGSASIQFVVLMPALFTIMFLGLQAALFYHAGALASAAAREGARVAGAENGSAGAGILEARDYIADTAGDSLRAAEVRGSRSQTTATVAVSGKPLSVIPGWKPTVRKSASVAVERITQ
jgi:Flp pilus assembly protein TadG